MKIWYDKRAGKPADFWKEWNLKMSMTVLDKIAEKKFSSKGQKALAAFFMEHTAEAVFMTAAKIGSTVGVSESTVVRFAMGLDYAGFPEFHNDLKAYVQEHLSEYGEAKDEIFCESQLVKDVLNADETSIHATMELLEKNSFDAAVKAIIEAKHIYIIGLRNSEPLARFLAFYLQLIRPDVYLLGSTNTTEVFEQMIRINEEDVAIGISFPGYSMRTLKALEFANDRKAKVIAITDNEHSPLKMYSSCNLYAPCAKIGILDSMVAPLSLMNALILAISREMPDAIFEHLKTLEEVWNNYQVYQNDEINEGMEYPEE